MAWGAVFAGAAIALVIQIILNMVGLGVGLSSLDVAHGETSPPGIIYKRITPHFFVVSSIRKDRIWYNRCNRTSGAMNCVLINYPAAEKRQWDSVVTRISHTLRG